MNATLPLLLPGTDLANENKKVQLNEVVATAIEQTVKAYAKEIDFSDSAATVNDLYINTIQLRGTPTTVYLVLLKHYPTGVVNSKVLFYNNQKSKLPEKTADCNLHAAYDF